MIKNITVIGAGTMGHGIAETFALHGYKVNIYEVNEEVRHSAPKIIREELSFMAENELINDEDIKRTLENIDFFDNLKQASKNADYVIEAAPEILELKRKIFSELDMYCKKETIFASNTSSLALNEMIEFLPEKRQKKSMVCHWYNPAHLMPIAELSFFGNMDEETFCEVKDLYENAGKQVVRVLKDVPGLVANRIQQGVAREVFSLIEKGIALPEDIDKALKFGPAFRYATTGQLEVADMGGLDIWATVGDNLLKVMDNSQKASPVLWEKVKEGKLGIKTGEGFFSYPEEKIQDIKNEFNKRLITQLKASKKYI